MRRDKFKLRRIQLLRVVSLQPSQHLLCSRTRCRMGCTELIFVEPGKKINGQIYSYREVLLTQHLLPAMKSTAGDFFVFQQNSPPSHRARETVDLLSQNTPDFISPFLWPPSSPDLNPVDYRIWRLLQELVYARLFETWNI